MRYNSETWKRRPDVFKFESIFILVICRRKHPWIVSLHSDSLLLEFWSLCLGCYQPNSVFSIFNVLLKIAWYCPFKARANGFNICFNARTILLKDVERGWTLGAANGFNISSTFVSTKLHERPGTQSHAKGFSRASSYNKGALRERHKTIGLINKYNRSARAFYVFHSTFAITEEMLNRSWSKV